MSEETIVFNSTIVHDLVLADLRVKRIEQELKDANELKDRLSSLIVEQWAAEGTDNQRVVVNGNRYTVFRRRDLFASVPAEFKDAIIDAVKSIGMESLIKTEVPTVGLKSYIAELVKGELPNDPFDLDAIPDEIRHMVKVSERTKAVVRKV